MNLKRKLLVTTAAVITALSMCSCSQASRVNANLTKEADNFNVVRELTVINCINNDIMFTMSGKMSITADTVDNQLEVIVEEDGVYKKHFVGLGDNVAYVITDLGTGNNDVSSTKFKMNFNPAMWQPVEVDTIE